LSCLDTPKAALFGPLPRFQVIGHWAQFSSEHAVNQANGSGRDGPLMCLLSRRIYGGVCLAAAAFETQGRYDILTGDHKAGLFTGTHRAAT